MTVSRILYKIFILLLFLLGVSIVGIVALFYLGDVNEYKGIITRKFKEVTGQELVIKGPIKLKVFPMPHGEFADAYIITSASPRLQIAVSNTNFTLTLSSFFSANKKIQSFKFEDMIVTHLGEEKGEPLFKVDHFSGRMIASCCHMELADIKWKQGKNEMSGRLNFSFASKLPQVTGELSTKHWDLHDESNSAPLAVLLDGVAHFNGKVKISGETIQAYQQTLKKGQLDIIVEDENLSIYGQGVLPEGKLNGKWIAKKSKNGVEAKTQFTVKGEQSKFFGGDLVLRLNESKVHVTGKLNTSRWVVPFFHSETDQSFSQSPIALAGFEKVTGQIDYHAVQLIFKKYLFEKADVKVNLTEKTITLSPIAKLAGGDLSGNIKIDRRIKKGFALNGNIAIKNANASEFLKLFKTQATVSGGSLNFTFQGQSRGEHETELMANLNGKSLLHITDMKVLNQQIDARYVDVFAALRKHLIPTKKNTVLECAVWKTRIKNGVAQSPDGVALETKELYALGTGSLRLKNGQLDYTFTIFPRSQIDIEIGSFSNVVYLTGTVNQPIVKTSARGVLQEGGTIILGVATGGVSLLAEKLFKLATQKGSPCKQVLAQQ